MRYLVTMVSIGALAALGATMVAAQDGGGEAMVSRTYDLAGFEGVSVVGPHHVTISVGPAFSVRAEGPQQTFDDTEVEIEDGRLKIHPVEDDRWERRRRGRDDWDGWDDYKPATFHDLRFSIAGSGDLVARGNARRSRVSIAGSGNLRAREVTSGEASVSIAGSGNAALTVDGDARVSIVGSGDVDIAGGARCSVSRIGSGNVRCNGAES